ncbi:hypothetical protein ANCDUO_13475 [Ancylostoma duodenale]|uniref:Serpin domain-containing protein n=1 Tax=Ancylostoma duodenale TaxID=51022 RepID=A0A0C2D2U1_9BILA|nr:hypothetical protein ANCDUO_13475 [Ancylostoma duodenale]
MVRKKLFLGLEIAQQYNDTITKDFNVTAERLDFRDQSLTVKTVNNFVSEATRQMIPNMLSSDFHKPDMRAFLVNAVYFKGQWATRFDSDVTQEDTFHGVNGDRKDKEYEFVIFLPLESVKFEEFRTNLTGAVMKELLETAENESAGVNPQMKHMLQQLGISQLFEGGCDLKGVCGTEDLFVDDVIHKAVVEVCFEFV